ncbi:CG5984 [Drosophila busckii]|uniref:CG5984 n=1 Tax=Drosophila busckii TaxID=30019 RepID=A0A0M4ES40_DROBS|nr:filamin-A isoform X1 [Drosophila busckii]ALC47497.1 CG5984 [Drosophila busckii]
MFKVSQEMRLNTNAAAVLGQSVVAGGRGIDDGNSPERECIFGRYQRTPDADAYPTEPPQVYVAPELTDAAKVQLLHLPSGAVKVNSTVSFIIKRNGVKGNFDARLELPSGQHEPALKLQLLDPERFEAHCQLTQAGLYKLHIKCNSVPLPKSPYIIVSIAGLSASEVPPISKYCYSTEFGSITNSNPTVLPVFQSDASKVISRGLGLTHINILERNEFTVDASAAGNNMLFVAILGPKGACEELLVKHQGNNLYRVVYQARDPGDYLLMVKWGDTHIPGSPFGLSAE